MTVSTTEKQQAVRPAPATGWQNETRPREGRPQPYPGEKARQGRIILNSSERRAVFIGGLVGIAIFVIVAMLLAA